MYEFLPRHMFLFLLGIYLGVELLVTDHTLWRRGLHNSVKLGAVPCRATHDGWVIVKSSDKTWATGLGNGSRFQYSCHENPVVTLSTPDGQYQNWIDCVLCS